MNKSLPRQKTRDVITTIVSLPKIEGAQALAQSVVSAIESAIIYGELPEGLRLTENVIVQRTGVSRSPIREALQILERDGLLTREHRKGVRIAELTTDDLDQLYACRIALETAAAQLAATSGKSSEIDRIRSSHLECERKYRDGDVLGHFRANVKMSQCIFDAAHNNQLTRLLDSIHKKALRYRYVAYQQSNSARENSVRCNAKLVEALLQRDAERAASLVREGIEASHSFIRTCLLERASNAKEAGSPPKNRR